MASHQGGLFQAPAAWGAPVGQPGRQRRFWEHTIRGDRDYATHVDYAHFNPVKHGLVSEVREWPCSSFHRHVARGAYPAAWAGGSFDVLEAGERS